MTLKFNVREDMSGYSLHIDSVQTNIEIGATEAELRRLMIDLIHEFDGRKTRTEAADSESRNCARSGGGEDG